MQIIVSDAATYGPFRTVETHADHYLADGVKWFFTVCGPNHRVEPQGSWTPPPPPPVPAPVPAEVPQWQARRALLAAGLLTAVEAAVAAASQDIQITWEYAPNIVRNSPFIAAMAPALGLTDAQIDDLFRAAAAIT